MLKSYSSSGKPDQAPVYTRPDSLKMILDLGEFFLVVLCIPLSYQIARILMKSFNYDWHVSIPQMTFFSILVLISWVVLSQATATAKLPGSQRYLTLLLHHIRIHMVVLIVLLLLKFIFSFRNVPVVFILIIVPVYMMITFGIKILATHIFRIYRSNDYNLRQVIVIADGNSLSFIDKIFEQKDWGYNIDTIISDSTWVHEKYGKNINVIQDEKNLKEYLDNNVIDEVIYSKSEINHNEIRHLIEICNEVGVIFRFQSCVSPDEYGVVDLKTYNAHNQLALVDIPANRLPLIIKNIADMYFAISAIILLSPLFLLIAILIKLESRGPVFFKQERLGLRGRKFKLYKFRTMVVNAEDLLESLRKSNEMDGPTFKMREDPRITRLGKFLRKTGLDELPQFFNIISGEMSLVGPRPPLESEVKQYKRWQLRRLSVKPGITCTWQISPNRNDVKFDKWMQLDLNYIDNWSLAKDAELFVKTIKTVFSASGR
jgi:exopolysaccharide biosynthesis polyprenyl glycosylphosphotransferase